MGNRTTRCCWPQNDSATPDPAHAWWQTTTWSETTLELLFAMRDDLEVVASIGSEEAAQVCVELQPDAVLMDYRLPGLNGAEATRTSLEVCPTVEPLIATIRGRADA